MAHRRRRHRMEMNAEINVVPLIDVMLLLLVIFMLTAPMMTSGLDLHLPEAGAQPGETRSGLRVSVSRTGVISVNDNRMDNLAQFRSVFPTMVAGKENLGVYLASDRDLDVGSWVRVIEVINNAGVTNLTLLTVPEERR